MSRATAAIVTIGSELVAGMRVDTNSPEIARALQPFGLQVVATISIADDPVLLSALLRDLIRDHALVITTGGLGPTHDDISRKAAARALDAELVRDPRLVRLLQPAAKRMRDPEAANQLLSQADVIPGASVIDPTTGTAPGQIVKTAKGFLALLPGPPAEMQGMLPHVLERFERVTAAPCELGVVGLAESDAQVRVDAVLRGRRDVGFVILARPGDVRIILTDEGAGGDGLDSVAQAVERSLGSYCYSNDGSSLAKVVVREATVAGLTIATAESCTGGMVAAAITDIPGSSACFAGGVVTYSDAAKTEFLDVSERTLAEYGAVSAQTVEMMALHARERLHADISIAVSGIAGPTGGTAEKPVGTVWFGLRAERIQLVGTLSTPSLQFERIFPPASRAAIRERACAVALDSVRRAILGLPIR